MALSIKDPEADRLAREVAHLTGETLTQAVVVALRERLVREQRRSEDIERLVEDVMEIARHTASLSVLDSRTDDEILGYDEHGLPN
jgi:antitoxin VapB